MVRIQGDDDACNPENSQRIEAVAMLDEQIENGQEQVHVHFVGQAPESDEDGGAICNVLNQKIVGEQAQAVQVNGDVGAVLKMAKRQSENRNKSDSKNAERINAKRSTHKKGKRDGLAGRFGFLPRDGTHENAASVHEKKQDAETAKFLNVERPDKKTARDDE